MSTSHGARRWPAWVGGGARTRPQISGRSGDLATNRPGRSFSGRAGRKEFDPTSREPPEEWTVDRFRKAKYALAGTVDQVKAEIEALQRIGGEGELEWFGWFFDQGFMPWEEEMRQIELFAEHIIPAFR